MPPGPTAVTTGHRNGHGWPAPSDSLKSPENFNWSAQKNGRKFTQTYARRPLLNTFFLK